MKNLRLFRLMFFRDKEKSVGCTIIVRAKNKNDVLVEFLKFENEIIQRYFDDIRLLFEDIDDFMNQNDFLSYKIKKVKNKVKIVCSMEWVE